MYTKSYYLRVDVHMPVWLDVYDWMCIYLCDWICIYIATFWAVEWTWLKVQIEAASRKVVSFDFSKFDFPTAPSFPTMRAFALRAEEEGGAGEGQR